MEILQCHQVWAGKQFNTMAIAKKAQETKPMVSEMLYRTTIPDF
jgi:hypothetical protein